MSEPETMLPAELFAELQKQRDFELTIVKLREELRCEQHTVKRLTELLHLRVCAIYDPSISESEESDL